MSRKAEHKTNCVCVHCQAARTVARDTIDSALAALKCPTCGDRQVTTRIPCPDCAGGAGGKKEQ